MNIFQSVLIDAVVRQLPGVLGDAASAVEDSFVGGLLDCPHYTRPEIYEGAQVPEVLLSGDPNSPRATLVVQVKVKEGNRERLQAYEGVVIAKRNHGLNSAFTVRKISSGEGVERTFQTYSPAAFLQQRIAGPGPCRRQPSGAFGQNVGMSAYGLFPAAHFVVTSGRCADAASLPQALWYFRDETIAVPAPGMPLAGYAPELSLAADLGAWRGQNAIGADAGYPPLVWLGAPEVLRHAALSADGRQLPMAEGALDLRLVPRLPLNRSSFDASSVAFFHGQPLKLRGWHEDGNFVARTFWPESFVLPEQASVSTLAAEPAALRNWLRAPQAGARQPYSVESVWRRPGSAGVQRGQPLFGLVLNGGQGDDDEAHSGHFAVMTGLVGEAGAIDDWLVNNFYTLDAESEKGILAAPVPLDNYLGDLNAGQAWYRPSWLLVVTLRRPDTAVHVQAAFGRVFNQFYRHQFTYQHARANCCGISVSTLRALGWQVPARGGESWLTATFGLPLLALRDRSLAKGKAMFDYLTEDRTCLYPAVSFAEAGADLLRLVRGESGRDLSDFERRLAEDIDEILLVRVPQFPSSRAWGDSPAEDSVEYRARVPKDPARRQIIPVPPRPFPPELRDPRSPKEPPLRSDYAVAAWAIMLIAVLLFILRRLLA